MHLGFVQVPDIPAALRQAKDCGCPIDLEDAIYFGGRPAYAATTVAVELLPVSG